MSNEPQSRRTERRLLYLLLTLATGCVPDVPHGGSETEDDAIQMAGGGNGGFRGKGSLDPNGPRAPGGGGTSGSGSPGGEPVPAPSGDGAGSAMGAMPEPEEVEPFRCDTDADCAAGLLCQNAECTFVPPERLPSALVQTAGGGLMQGAGLRLQLRVGAPPPIGRMSGNGHRLTLGPLAGH